MAEVLLMVSAPVPEASSVAVPAVPIVKRRSVDTVAPVYCNVPPLIIRLAAALVELPMLLTTPPSARVLTASVPLLMVVVPV